MKLRYELPIALLALALVLGAPACSGSDSEDCAADNSCPVPSAGGASGEGGAVSGASGAAAGGNAGDGAGESAGGGGAGGDGAGTEAGPRVLAISPEDGAKGVTRDEPIVITFSEPMDPTTTEEAFTSTDLDDHFAIEWDDSGTIMTVTPDEPYEYAAGPDESHAAREYAVSVRDSAESALGEPLAERFDSRFATLREVALSLAPEHANSVGNDEQTPSLEECLVGDSSTQVAYRCYASFSLESIPEGRQLESARWRGYVLELEGSPFDDLGGLNLEHMPAVTPPAPFDAEALSTVATVTTAPEESAWLELDVLEAIQDDLAHRDERGDRAELRFRFGELSDGDSALDLLTFDTSTNPDGGEFDQTLELTYFVP